MLFRSNTTLIFPAAPTLIGPNPDYMTPNLVGTILANIASASFVPDDPTPTAPTFIGIDPVCIGCPNVMPSQLVAPTNLDLALVTPPAPALANYASNTTIGITLSNPYTSSLSANFAFCYAFGELDSFGQLCPCWSFHGFRGFGEVLDCKQGCSHVEGGHM